MPSESRRLGRHYRENDVIYRQGETGNEMYIVQLGEVELIHRKGDKEFCLAVVRQGEFFGEMALFGYPVRNVTARVIGESASVISLEQKAFLKRMHFDPSLVFNMLKTMADRIQHLEKQLVQYGEAMLPPELQ